MCIPSKSPYQNQFQGGNFVFALNQLDQMNYPSPESIAVFNGVSLNNYDNQSGFQDVDATIDKEHVVQHNYHDHANDDCTRYLEAPIVCKGGVTVPFPLKLHDMLDYIDLNEPELASIVSWQPHGRCFVVKKIKQFTSEVLPRFFDQKKYASFQRQLNLYGFNRITTGPDRGAYYHEMFLRSKKILCRAIYRKKVKGTGTRMASNPEQEPNFYLMESMPETSSDISSLKSEDEPVARMKEEEEVTMPPLPLPSVSGPTPNLEASFKSSVNLEDVLSSSAAPEELTSSDVKLLASALDLDCTNDDDDNNNNQGSNHYYKFDFDDSTPFNSLDYSPIPISYNNKVEPMVTTSSSLSEDDTSCSTLTPDVLNEMDALGDLSLDMDLTDDELGDLLDKIVDDDFIFPPKEGQHLFWDGC
jgi:hypothetical protein